MTTDLEFTKEADAYMARLLEALDEIDPDVLDCQLSQGVLAMEFADGRKSIMNRQTAAHQIWLAEGATAWHFAKDSESGDWQDTKGRGELRKILSEALTRRLGIEVTL